MKMVTRNEHVKDLSYTPLAKVINTLQELLKKYPEGIFNIDAEYGSTTYDVYIEYQSPQTPEEAQSRKGFC